MKKKISILIPILLILFLCGKGFLDWYSKREENKENVLPSLVVSFIDVEQGDSAWIEFPDGKTALIDAGEASAAENVIDYIEDCGHDTIDYIICTHPHSDHIGGMREIIETFQVGAVYMPKASHTSKTFEKLLLAIQEKGLKIHAAKAGVSVSVTPEITMEFLGPCSDSYEDLNNYSAVMRLSYGDNAFLFTGDAEVLAEKEILDGGKNIQADVLKVGHHGSVTSSCEEFLQAVSPKWAVISSGKGNDYGHPHQETLDALEKMNITVLRTDQKGTISFTANGDSIQEGRQ